MRHGGYLCGNTSFQKMDFKCLISEYEWVEK